jgi:peptide/nickel transport system permease protein
MLAFTIRRVLLGLLLLWFVTLLVFIATSVVPGDPVGRILGRFANEENTAALRAQFGLDMSPPERYLDWLGGLLQGDLGTSLTRSGTPVSELVGERLRNSLLLAAIAMAALVPLSVGLGVWAGLRANRPVDRVISGLTLTFVAVPDFVVGALLILVFAAWTDLLPPVSLVAPGTNPISDPEILVLPILTVLIATLALGVRMVRSGMIEVMTSEYVELARLNGIPERRLVVRHALRNALAPSIQVLALLFQWMIGGLITVEVLFNYPGIGLGLVDAVTSNDFTYVQSVATLLAASYVVLYLIADLLVALAVPKLRTGSVRS